MNSQFQSYFALCPYSKLNVLLLYLQDIEQSNAKHVVKNMEIEQIMFEKLFLWREILYLDTI